MAPARSVPQLSGAEPIGDTLPFERHRSTGIQISTMPEPVAASKRSS